MISSPQTRNTLVWGAVSAVICGLVGLVYSKWLFWGPGAVFGFLFFIVNMRGKLRTILYTAACTVIYYGAVIIFVKAKDFNLPPTASLLTGGLLAGLFGALALAIVTKFVNHSSIHWRDEAQTTLVGAMMGIAFGLILLPNRVWLPVQLPLAFAVWQVPVGWSLTASLQKQSSSRATLPANASR